MPLGWLSCLALEWPQRKGSPGCTVQTDRFLTSSVMILVDWRISKKGRPTLTSGVCTIVPQLKKNIFLISKMFQWKRVWMYLSILFDPRGRAQAPHAWMGSHRQCWVSPKASGVCVERLHGQWRTFLRVILTDLMLHCCDVITGKLDNIHKQQ